MSGRRRPRAQKRAGKPRTLRSRLVVASVVLIAVVCAVIGTVTTLALRSHLYEQLDGQLNEIAMRASGNFPRPPGVPKGGSKSPAPQKQGQASDLSTFVTRGPQPIGTIAAKVTEGAISDAKVGRKSDDTLQMTPGIVSDAVKEALAQVPPRR
ncbi:hypothetical protein SALBM311S_13047 [Streptomyces alboniger]